MASLAPEFYDRPVLEVARALIGCTVEHGGAAGVIVETEAYHESEPACHAFVGLTPRTRILFGEPGRAYVYRSYGIHALLNAVCEPAGVGAAVLIRALSPTAGVEGMRARRVSRSPAVAVGAPERGQGGGGRPSSDERDLCSGPGKLTQALGISLAENGGCLARGPVRIGPRPPEWRDPPVLEGPRVGISHAVELPWRFCLADCVHVSRPQLKAGRGPGSAARRDAAGR
jgi:DNA-3-methyladenine glycosylase